MADDSRVALAQRMVSELPKFGSWANGFRDFETPWGKIGFRQAAILWVLRFDLLDKGNVSPTGLAEFHRVQPSVITRALARLEAGGFIERHADPADGRRAVIVMTDRGRRISEYIEKLYISDMLAGMAFLDDAQVAELDRNVERLSRIVESLEREHRDGASQLKPRGE